MPQIQIHRNKSKPTILIRLKLNICCRMSNVNQEGQNSNRMAFVLGYTGETGKSLVKELSRRALFKRVVLMGRREVKLDKNLGPEFVSMTFSKRLILNFWSPLVKMCCRLPKTSTPNKHTYNYYSA